MKASKLKEAIIESLKEVLAEETNYGPMTPEEEKMIADYEEEVANKYAVGSEEEPLQEDIMSKAREIVAKYKDQVSEETEAIEEVEDVVEVANRIVESWRSGEFQNTINDPVLMKTRAAAHQRTLPTPQEPKPVISKASKNADKIAMLKRERAQLMQDMEQEAELEGGPIADKYGVMLNRIDKAINKLSGRNEWGDDEKDANLSYDEIQRRASMINTLD
jgi:hypothetical protein